MKRVRPDIELPISFLCTRVKSPTVKVWDKLKRVIQFLYGTIKDNRIIGFNDLASLLTYVDASYAVHNNMRSHTGGMMTFGKGIIHGKASKQKLNVKSSTEAEVVGMSDYLPFSLWMANFLDAQGYKLLNNIVLQDNMSAMKMEKNGRLSCTGNLRHIDIRFFFTKDRCNKKEISIEHCPTEEMLSDFYTKPQQGSLFHKMRAVLMGWASLDSLKKIDKTTNIENNVFPVIFN